MAHPNITTRQVLVVHRQGREGTTERSLEFLDEELLALRLDDAPWFSTMRTPGLERELAAGFCLGEGLVSSPEGFVSLEYAEDATPPTVEITLDRTRGAAPFSATSSCSISVEQAFDCLDEVDRLQEYYLRTRCSHGVLLFDGHARLLSSSEDVGRHNAVDKTLGAALLQGDLHSGRVLAISSRNNYEIMRKVARTPVEIVLSKSRPTARAALMGHEAGLTLAYPDTSKKEDLVIICGEGRITGAL